MKHVKKVVVYGDSILAGIGIDENSDKYHFLNKSCIDYIKEEYNYEITNYSKFCQTTTRALSTMSKRLINDHDYDIAVIELGGNDSDFNWAEVAESPSNKHLPKTTIKDYTINLITMINLFRHYGIEPILVTLPPINAEKYFSWISRGLNKENLKKWLKNVNIIYRFQERYSLVITNVAMQHNVKLFDLRKDLLEIHDYDNYLCRDGIHLNENGHQLISTFFRDNIGASLY